MLAWLSANTALVVTALGWGLSELVAFFPGIKSNSVLQLIGNIVSQIVLKMSATK